ncbi:outer membrane protein assembly factor BamE [Catenovulum sp. 2E275]|uniref:outer membrane protein assembly factor BamE n=1 Tax=Catenovulum sp. 2E275 TaxID=2980497 RepID=UPI0021CE15B5|nr:outer membrane protein assembly factor BamE [Catenovulum sp. 2E275]MCU4676725.1 outer membrane protein assembly factor BamE [Catenovulum sp. 2E275]
MKSMITLALALALASCAYKIDVRQGNYIEKKDVDKLRQNMTKEQVAYVLGKPIIEDAFNQSTWYYLYNVEYGDGRPDRRIELTLQFENNQLKDMQGTIDKPEDFEKSLDL